MNTEQVKQHLKDKLPEFDIWSSEEVAKNLGEVNLAEPNEARVFIHRDGQGIYMDISRIDNEKDADSAVEFINIQYKKASK